MLRLRLTQSLEAGGVQRVEAALEGAGVRQTAVTTFQFAVAPEDRERVRWYLEDYLEYPLDPAPEIATEVARRLGDLGAELFRDVFQSSDDARDLWAVLRGNLDSTRVEVLTDVADATAIPWELLRDPKTDVALALRARAFVRAQHQTAQPVRLPGDIGGHLRVLLVICRPEGARDVPFRSVASHLVRLSSEARDAFDLDVLRPPSFAQLAKVLRAARDAGRPYHVVHFDGHGTYIATDGSAQAGADASNGQPQYTLLSPPRPGSHGFLLFEDPTTTTNRQLVDGPAIGNLLADAGVPVLVLNACRSAHAEAPTAPTPDDPRVVDVHERVRAYGSLAQEVVDAGVPGVVAMRYNVWVATAAQFVGELYAELLRGSELGAAVTRGRKQLAAQPNRAVAFEPLPLQDWMVPVVYEAAPLTLASAPPASTGALQIHLDDAAAASERAHMGTLPPSAPDVGFYGRDETLLALDRAFDRDRIVLLHAYAGSGKTTTAAEFARWYQHTGGLASDGGDGPVLFTTFERHRPLALVLEEVGKAFEAALAAVGFEWGALPDDQRAAVALQVLAQVPVLWIWDNVEPVTGFPEGAHTPWSPREQDELAAFLRTLRGTRAKVLLTSRRREQSWLGDLPVRVELPPMPMRDSVQLARAIVDRHPPHRLTDVEDWRPLLRLADGNPLTISVLVGQVLRERLTTRDQIGGFVERVRTGTAQIADDERQGRSASLAASLSYGLASAFDDGERARLAVLHLFQEFVDADTLVEMGRPELASAPPELWAITRGDAIALLDRAAEIGLLRSYGSGYYGIHPALPWYFARLFTETYGPPGDPRAETVARAYAEAIARIGMYWFGRLAEGRTADLPTFEAEEANLLHARRLAREHDWWEVAILCMAALSRLYEHAGRASEWRRLVLEMVPDFVDEETGGPRPGREAGWEELISYQAELARSARDWEEGERLARMLVELRRGAAVPALQDDAAPVDDDARSAISALAQALGDLGRLLFEQRRPECVETLLEAFQLRRRVGSGSDGSSLALVIGNAYLAIDERYDVDEAERWYEHGLSLLEEQDELHRGFFLDALGGVHRRRLVAGLERGAPDSELRAHLQAAVAAYEQALELIPADAVSTLAVTHDHLAKLWEAAGYVDNAVREYLESVKYEKLRGNHYGAGQSRYSIARLLARHDRFGDALKYAQAARADFAHYPPEVVPQLESLLEAIEQLEQLAAGEPEGPPAPG